MQEILEAGFQQKFLDNIKKVLPPSHSLVHEISDKLGVSIDSAYRRLRNQTSMSIDEAVMLARAYGLSLDSLVSPDNSVTFNYRRLDSIERFYEYFQNFYNHLGLIIEKKGNLIYAADDIPIFHNFLHRDLGAFKLFYFLRSVCNFEEFRERKFSPSVVPEDLLKLTEACYQRYLEVPSIEIWNDKTVDGTLWQLEFFYDAGLYEDKNDLIRVAEKLMDTIKVIEQQVAAKSKKHEDNYSFYEVELMVGNNCVLVNIGDNKICFIRHQTVNTMATSHYSFNVETELFLNNLISKSNLLSGAGEKSRHRFFRNIYAKIDKVLEKLKS
jgi:transcriptional regulator with XRE-family HTH domain